MAPGLRASVSQAVDSPRRPAPRPKQEAAVRYWITIFMAVVMISTAVSPGLAAGPDRQGLPLETGTMWVYEGPVSWGPDGSDSVTERVMTWEMAVTETIERQHVFAAVIKGYPLDLAFYEEGETQPGTYLIIRLGTDLYYLLVEERVPETLNRLRDDDDILTDLVYDSECILDLPLESGKIFGETFQLARQDGMYFWNVTGEDAIVLKDIEGTVPESQVSQYGLAFLTLSDDLRVEFVPGLGFTRYVYNHHGSTAELDLRLVAYHPGGRSEAVRLTGADAGKSIEVAKGDRLEITLEANPTTGYIWEVGSGDADILEMEGEPDCKTESDAIGAGGAMTFRFRAVETGTTDLELVYHRPWEEDQEPAETFTVTVTVK